MDIRSQISDWFDRQYLDEAVKIWNEYCYKYNYYDEIIYSCKDLEAFFNENFENPYDAAQAIWKSDLTRADFADMDFAQIDSNGRITLGYYYYDLMRLDDLFDDIEQDPDYYCFVPETDKEE